MPFLDDFPAYLRDELDRLYDEGVGELFDITEARQALQSKKLELVAECEANSKLQHRFDLINSQLRGGMGMHSAVASADDVAKNDFDRLDDETEIDVKTDEGLINGSTDDNDYKDDDGMEGPEEVLVNLATRVEEYNKRSQGYDYDLADL